MRLLFRGGRYPRFGAQILEIVDEFQVSDICSSEIGGRLGGGDRRSLAPISFARRSEVSGVFSSNVFSTGVGCRR